MIICKRSFAAKSSPTSCAQAGSDQEGFAELLDLIRKQARNREGRDVSGTLEREIEELHERFLLTPRDKPWGDPAIIWPEQCPALASGDLSLLAERFERALFQIHPTMEERHRKDWKRRVGEMRALHNGSSASDKARQIRAASHLPACRANPDTFV